MKPKNEEALKEAEEEVSPAKSPGAETKATEEVEEPAEQIEKEAESTDEATFKEKSEGEPTETEEKPKKGYTQRVRELANKANEAEERANSLEDKLATLTGRDEPAVPRGPAYEPQVEAGAEVTAEQYKQDVVKAADALVTLRVKQSEAANRINNEASEVIGKYPELDPDSDEFNGELSDTITEATEAYVKANPYTASVKGFVGKQMKLHQGAVTKEVGKASKQVAKQATEAALKPTSVRKGEKTAEEKSIAELEKELGVFQG